MVRKGNKSAFDFQKLSPEEQVAQVRSRRPQSRKNAARKCAKCGAIRVARRAATVAVDRMEIREADLAAVDLQGAAEGGGNENRDRPDGLAKQLDSRSPKARAGGAYKMGMMGRRAGSVPRWTRRPWRGRRRTRRPWRGWRRTTLTLSAQYNECSRPSLKRKRRVAFAYAAGSDGCTLFLEESIIMLASQREPGPRGQRLWNRLDPPPDSDHLRLSDPIHLAYLANFSVRSIQPGHGFGGYLLLRKDGHAKLLHDDRLPNR